MLPVTIRGAGIAAYTCAFLLNQADVPVHFEESSSPKIPVIMLSGSAVALLRETFQQPDLLCAASQIHKRVVAWKRNSPPIVLDHYAIAVSEASLLESLRGMLPANGVSHRERSWLIIASRPLPDTCFEQRFGTRKASIAHVELRVNPNSVGGPAVSENAAAGGVPIETAGGPDARNALCWIESVEDGWLFLIEDGIGAGWLLAVGGSMESLLDQSSVVAEHVLRRELHSESVPAYPRIVFPLCGAQWLACGRAAMAFDPVCGDGTAHAVREGILAAAVVRAALESPEETQDLLAHYQTRLLAGFRKHLALCRDFYRGDDRGTWWSDESAELKRGLEWCGERLRDVSAFRYRLEGFELIRIP